MNTECVVPEWLHDIILGYGDPGSAHYSKMPNQISSLDFNDTFLSIDHLRSCFPGYTVKVTKDNPELLIPAFRSEVKVQMEYGWGHSSGGVVFLMWSNCNISFNLLLFSHPRIKFHVQNRDNKGKRRKADEEKKEEDKLLIVEPHVTPNREPYPYNQAKQ